MLNLLNGWFQKRLLVISLPDEYYTFETKEGNGNEYMHWLHVAESNLLAFSVMACRDVEIVFSDQLGTVSSEAVTLQLNPGGSGSKLVKQNGDEIASIEQSLIHCDSMATLWASFINNNFRSVHFFFLQLVHR